jgi:molybdopterin converting factor small subunit
VRVEFFGIPRERAGVAELEIQAETLGELFATLATHFPSLAELRQSGRSPFLASLNGGRFVSDPDTRLSETDCVLILSAEAGG